MRNGAAISHVVTVAGDDDVVPLRQRPTDRLERPPAHQDGLARCHSLEVGQVRGDVPGELAIPPDDVGRGHGDDKGDQWRFVFIEHSNTSPTLREEVNNRG